MGIVYKAQDKRSGNIIAIKQLLLESVDPQKHDEFKDRFVRESKTALRLNHENIVKVLEVSENPGDYFYVMEYLDGRSLRDDLLKRSKPYSIEDFWPILRQITEGLSFAHAMNVVHRDVKPDNIFLLRDGTVKITDFGIARAADFEATHLTKTGVMLGTLAYVSPEQLQNAKNVDHRADIFSLAVVTYEALSGKLPFTGEGIAQTIVKIMSSEEVPLNKLNSAIPEELAAVVSKALRKKPKDRYRATKEFLRDFQVCAEKICGDLGSSLEDLIHGSNTMSKSQLIFRRLIRTTQDKNKWMPSAQKQKQSHPAQILWPFPQLPMFQVPARSLVQVPTIQSHKTQPK